MARPKADVDKYRNDLLDAAEAMLAETGGRRLVLSELAARLGLSQSYAHRFFGTKDDLVGALAERWFAQVEEIANANAKSGMPAEDRLRGHVLGILAAKRDRFDADPSLFLAYLELAKGHMEKVQEHTNRLTAILTEIVAELVGPPLALSATRLVEDATARFRIPAMIAATRSEATDERAEAVIEMLLAELASWSGGRGSTREVGNTEKRGR